MKKIWYSKGGKTTSAILQGLLAGLLVLCLLAVREWADGDYGLSDTSRSFDRTDLFFRTVETIVREKIDYSRNKELFERNGSFDEYKVIDLRQYTAGITDEANLNVNTAYYIQDLLTFSDNGSAAMGQAIRQAYQSRSTDEGAGMILSERATDLETVLPISGSPLADYARLSSNSYAALLEYYRLLCEVADDVALRYAQYESASQDSAQSPDAPSNVRYYVENTSTKQRYTNMGVTSLSAAQAAAADDETLTILFVGERRFNIMVANADYAFNEEATSWFMQTRFVGSGEKVLIAADRSFPIGDQLQNAYWGIRRQRPYIWAALVCSAFCMLAIPALLVCAVLFAGRMQKGGDIRLTSFDEIPTEIAGGLGLITAISWWILGNGLPRSRSLGVTRSLVLIVFIAIEYWILLACFLSLVRRIKAKTLWSNSVCHAVVMGGRAVYGARQRSQRIFFGYLGIIVANVFFLFIGGVPGIIMFLVLNLAVLLYLMRDAIGNQSIREGLKQISQGKLEYRINTDVLTGESREMGDAVNEMGEGLQSAVEDMLRNERLRAELITNVSHDLKTPLTSIMNYVDLLKREQLQDARAAGYVEVLDQKTRRLKQLTEDLIEVSKISSGNIELHPSPMKLRQFLYQAVGEFEEQLEERNIALKLDVSKEDLIIDADGKQLWRVFENLLGNMVKYAKEGTEARVTLMKKDAFADIIFYNVSSRRITHSAQELKERFARGDQSRSQEGSGLGLSIAESLTMLMGGTFELSVTEETFQAMVRFPVSEAVSK